MQMLQRLNVNKNILKQINRYLGKDDFERFKQLSGLSKDFIIESLTNNKDKEFVKKINTCLLINELSISHNDNAFVNANLPLDVDFIKSNGYSKELNYLESFIFKSLDNNNEDLLKFLIKNFEKKELETTLFFEKIIGFLAWNPKPEIIKLINDNVFDLNKEYNIKDNIVNLEDLIKRMMWQQYSINDLTKYESLTPLEFIGNITQPIFTEFDILYVLGYSMNENKLNDQYTQLVQNYNREYSKKEEIEYNLNQLLNSSNDVLKPINDNINLSLHEKVSKVDEKLKEYTKLLYEYNNKLALANGKEYRLEKIKEHQKEDITIER